jgi:hypothetical protein
MKFLASRVKSFEKPDRYQTVTVPVALPFSDVAAAFPEETGLLPEQAVAATVSRPVSRTQAARAPAGRHWRRRPAVTRGLPVMTVVSRRAWGPHPGWPTRNKGPPAA